MSSNKRTKLSLETRKRRNITSENTDLPERLSEKVFVIDKNDDVTDVKDGARGRYATDVKPFVIPPPS